MRYPLCRFPRLVFPLGVAVTLGACGLQENAGKLIHLSDSISSPKAADSVDEGAQAAMPGESGSDEYARQQALRIRARQQYDFITDWLRDAGLGAKSYPEMAALADTDASASQYVQCHDAASAPDTQDSRLGFLSACLRGDVSLADAQGPEAQSVAYLCGDEPTGMPSACARSAH